MANPEHLKKLQQGVHDWNQWREENKDIRPDLSKADLRWKTLPAYNLANANLRNARLHGANLRTSDLSGANLTEADLYGTDFTTAKLTNANMSGASINEAIFFRADVSGANLSRAYLIMTNLASAKLDKTNWDEATCLSTIFADVDLSQCQNLESVRHTGASTIGLDTIYKSGGNIPHKFLVGCGVPEKMITFAKSLVGTAIDYFSCFISYSTSDETFAKLLYDTLQGQGVRCWFAPEQILPGERLDLAIDSGIRYWDKVLFCASKSSLTEKWWVDFEVNKAFKKARDLQRERGLPVDVIIPLNLDGYLFSSEFDKTPKRSLFEMTLAADFVGWEKDIHKFNRQVERVIRALRIDSGKEEPPASKL